MQVLNYKTQKVTDMVTCNRGGKRKGAGRKPSLDKKQTIVVYIETSKIDNAGGVDELKKEIYRVVDNRFKKL